MQCQKPGSIGIFKKRVHKLVLYVLIIRPTIVGRPGYPFFNWSFLVSESIRVTRDRVFNLFEEVYKALVNFPKSEKYALQQMIKNDFGAAIAYLQEAETIVTIRTRRLVDAMAKVNLIGVWLEFAYRQKMLSVGFWEILSARISGIKIEINEHIERSKKKRTPKL